MMYPEQPPAANRITKSVSFGPTEDDENDNSETSSPRSRRKFQDNDSEQSSQVVDSKPDNGNTNGGKANKNNNGDSTLEVPLPSQRKVRRRSLLMRMVDEESDFLPPRESMLKSQRIELGEEFTLSSDDEEDDDEEKRKKKSFTVPDDMEQASKPKAITRGGEFTFKKFKHLPDIVVSPTKDVTDNRRYLTEEEIRKLHMSEDDLIKKSLVMTNCMRSILVALLILAFGFTAVAIGYKIGQNE